MTDALGNETPTETHTWLEHQLELAAENPTESRRAEALRDLEERLKRDARASVEAELARLQQETAARIGEQKARQQADLERARLAAGRSERRLRVAGGAIGALLLAGTAFFVATRGASAEAPADAWQGVEQAAREARAARDGLARSTNELRQAEKKARLREAAALETAQPELVPARDVKPPARIPRGDNRPGAQTSSRCTGDPNDPLNPQLGC
jgi:hypothetical protein